MSDIPADIFLDILKRVPVELLFRFRSVCKTWCRIIDDPAFAKQHMHRGIGGQWFFHKHDKSGKIFLLPIKELIYSNNNICNSSAHWIYATNVETLVGCDLSFPMLSCNGLILLSSSENNWCWRIWNPFTGESLEIGKCDEFPNNFDRSWTGFGYDEANDDYKVVNIFGYNTYVYTVNSKKWRKIDEDIPNSLINPANGVFAYGALHWLAYPWERTGDVGWISALDLSTEKYRKIVLPSDIIQESWQWDGLELNSLSGCLFLSGCCWRGNLTMWIIRDYGCKDTWIKTMSSYGRNVTPLAYFKSKEQLLLHRNKREYLWYDEEIKCSEKVSIEVNVCFDDAPNYYKRINDTFSSHFFPASLIRLKRSDVSDERVSSQETSKRKIKRSVAVERFPLKFMFRYRF